MGRNRKNKSDNKLPKYVVRGYKTFDYKPVLENGKRGYIRLCPLDSPISVVWEEYEKLQEQATNTLGWLLDEYQGSREFEYRGTERKSGRTIKDQLLQIKRIKTFKVKGGRIFGQIARNSITKGVIRAYLDKRLEQGAPVAGNREKALISKAWNWALERDKIFEPNPCMGVARNPEKPRDRYVTDQEYQIVYNLSLTKSDKSTRPPPSYVPICMELAYLCRMRISEVLAVTKTDIKELGLDTRRLKGSKDAVTEWTDRLRSAVDSALKLPGASVMLIHNKEGSAIKYSAFNSAWTRLMGRADEQGVEPFTFHDLKAKGVSDFEGNKQKASGHKTSAMVARYDRKKLTVKATR